MRTTFIQHLTEHARRKDDIFLLVGDLGFSVIESFAEEFPHRFINVGIAEQNMSGIASGLASEGFHVFTYSIANFPTLRCLEQIRNDICYHQLPVTVVSVGGGMSYGSLGYSHHAVQDYGIMRTMPNLDAYTPADPRETIYCLDSIVRNRRPSYLRLGKSGEKILHEKNLDSSALIRIHGQIGAMIGIVGIGPILEEVVNACKLFPEVSSQPIAIYSLPKVNPIDEDVIESLGSHRHLLIVEEHVRPASISESLALALSGKTTIHSLAVDSNNPNVVGSQNSLRKVHRIDSMAVRSKILDIVVEQQLR